MDWSFEDFYGKKVEEQPAPGKKKIQLTTKPGLSKMVPGWQQVSLFFKFWWYICF